MISKFIHNTLANIFRPYHKLKLRGVSTLFGIYPQPKYISQFADIYSQEIQLGQKLTNQKHISKYGAKDSDEFSFWVWRNCGIACVKMILDAKTEHEKTMMDLTREGIELGGYVLYDEHNHFVDEGWFHKGLVALLRRNGITAKMNKWQSAESVAEQVLSNKYIIISVQIPGRSSISADGKFENTTNSSLLGHLMLVTKVKIKNGKVVGFFAHDPRGLPNYEKDTWISADIFEKIFSGRTIVAG